MSQNNDNSHAYPNLLTPLTIGKVTIRNRLMQTAHAKGFHAGDGLTNNRDIYYQAERAKGGVGLIVIGARHVHPNSTGPHWTMACGHRSDNTLYGEMRGHIENLHCIDDAQLPRPLQDVIYEGMLAGRELLDSPDRFIEHGALEDFDESWRKELL